ncbi:MAG TPA: SDR family NAD(P)-dependent oxidoreductase [Nannocystaceae bacterium]|nr:SDR family NAD(P)-dependent oxidoreductase [Nannocystaceae bacterium]
MATAAINTDMSGKYCLITGAGTGLGREIGRNLARLGANVILTSYDFGLAEDARMSIAGQHPAAHLSAMTLDLSKRISIHDFIDVIHERVPKIDVWVNVVNRSSREKIESELGFEITWTMNVLGPYVLLRRLQDLLKAGAPSRIVNVVSPFAGGLNFDDPDFDTHAYNGMKAYRQSMQAARLFTYAAGSQLAIHGITANACVPGVVRGDPGAGLISGLFAKSAAAAADTPTWLAASPEVQGVTGKLFMDRAQIKCKFRDPAERQQLWELLERQANR